MAVHKKEDATVANIYCPESVKGPLPKFYMACLSNQISIKVENGNWQEPTQAGFHRKYCREGLIMAVDYLIDRA